MRMHMFPDPEAQDGTPQHALDTIGTDGMDRPRSVLALVVPKCRKYPARILVCFVVGAQTPQRDVGQRNRTVPGALTTSDVHNPSILVDISDFKSDRLQKP